MRFPESGLYIFPPFVSALRVGFYSQVLNRSIFGFLLNVYPIEVAMNRATATIRFWTICLAQVETLGTEAAPKLWWFEDYKAQHSPTANTQVAPPAGIQLQGSVFIAMTTIICFSARSLDSGVMQLISTSLYQLSI